MVRGRNTFGQFNHDISITVEIGHTVLLILNDFLDQTSLLYLASITKSTMMEFFAKSLKRRKMLTFNIGGSN